MVGEAPLLVIFRVVTCCVSDRVYGRARPNFGFSAKGRTGSIRAQLVGVLNSGQPAADGCH